MDEAHSMSARSTTLRPFKMSLEDPEPLDAALMELFQLRSLRITKEKEQEFDFDYLTSYTASKPSFQHRYCFHLAVLLRHTFEISKTGHPCLYGVVNPR